MNLQDMATHGCLLCCGDVDEPDDSAVAESADNGQFPKILVKRNKHPVLTGDHSQDLFVAGILGPLPGPDDVMA